MLALQLGQVADGGHLAAVDDDDPLAGLLRLAENVRRVQDGVLLAQLADQVARLALLDRIEASGTPSCTRRTFSARRNRPASESSSSIAAR